MASDLAAKWKKQKTAAEKALKDGKKAGVTTLELPKFKDDFQKNLDKLAKFAPEIQKLLAQVDKLATAWETQAAKVQSISKKYAGEVKKLPDNGFGNKRSLRQTAKEDTISVLTQLHGEAANQGVNAKQLQTVVRKISS